MLLLQLTKLSKSFGGLQAVRGVDLEIHQDEIFGLIGPNGSGKTTIFNLISGALQPTEGSIKFREEEITYLKPHEICKRGISRTFQIARPFAEVSVYRNVMIGALNHASGVFEAARITEEALSVTNLLSKRDVNGKNLTIPERRRLELARSLATQPKLLMLDEPMAGLNPTEVEEMSELVREIRKMGITIFIIEHVLQAIMSLSDRIAVLNYGEKIVQGTPEEIGANSKVVEAYLGEEYLVAESS
jgi:branched-chain amino acid transport system ATP-binding protein